MSRKRGCLVIHGLTGTPETMRCITEQLQRMDFDTVVPYVVGHESSERELAAVNWQQWVNALLIECDQLAKRVDDLFVVGLSMGALLTLKLAIERRALIKGAAFLSTALFLPPHIEKLAMPIVWNTPIKYLYKWQVKSYEDSVNDPVGLEAYKKTGFPRIPISAVDQLIKLQKIVRRDIHLITTPAIIIHAREDTVTPLHNALHLYETLASTRCEMILLGRSKHVLTMDYEKEIVAAAITEFFKQC